jgi:acyl carrier protein
MSATAAKLQECFALVFPDLAEAEIPNASMASVGSWDSVASINLVTVIEEEFGIQLEPEELEEMASFATVLDLLERKLA